MQPPPGYGQQGPYGQPGPAYGPPGYGPGFPPPKKKRTGLILGLSGGGVVVLGVGITLAVFASGYYKSVGSAPSSATPPAECQVAPDLLAKIGNTSYVSDAAPNANVPDLKQIGCAWRPPESENVRDRGLNVYIAEYSGDDAEGAAQRSFHQYHDEGPTEDVPGIGDRAVLTRLQTSSAFSGAKMEVLQGPASFSVELSGWDKGFFANGRIPQEEADSAVKLMAAEIVKRLPR